MLATLARLSPLFALGLIVVGCSAETGPSEDGDELVSSADALSSQGGSTTLY